MLARTAGGVYCTQYMLWWSFFGIQRRFYAYNVNSLPPELYHNIFSTSKDAFKFYRKMDPSIFVEKKLSYDIKTFSPQMSRRIFLLRRCSPLRNYRRPLRYAGIEYMLPGCLWLKLNSINFGIPNSLHCKTNRWKVIKCSWSTERMLWCSFCCV